MNKKKIIVCVALLLVAVLVGGGIFWMKTGGKAPNAYTWEEYLSMSNEEQDELFQRFETLEDFEAWKESVQPTETEPDFQWKDTGKLPDEYSWEEYTALTAEEREAFYQWFESTAAFEAWKDQAEPEETDPQPPVWNDQERNPDEYTWAEYQALTPEAQDAFYLWFPSQDAFEAWMSRTKPTETTPSHPTWDLPGKDPDAYTWSEYQALSPEQQDAFYHWFASVKAFEAWMDAAHPNETELALVWDKPGKLPDAYTWSEYQALTPEEQDLFYQWFSSRDAFESWLDLARDEESEL